ncbi:MAG: hypothetical protein QNJ17_07720 [Desulfocapsaceae bacterium]|nr:hypothetical protein [Desulfocapsaceae bacterium]
MLGLFTRWKDGVALTGRFVADKESLKHTLKQRETELKRLDLMLSMRKPCIAVLESKANLLGAFLLKDINPLLST